jgi:D-glycero-D-manno-heptose 1,7-bisphosphate phosphatase
MAVTAPQATRRFSWTAAPGDLARRRHGPNAVLFDRDGTLVQDVPYNTDPSLVRAVAGVRDALDALRDAEVRIGVVTNQSGLATGRVREDELAAVNREVERQLGRFDVWCVCPHAYDEGCRCRKPAPGLVLDACARLGVAPSRTVVVGDIGADVDAGLAAGAVGILVPTAATRLSEIEAAPMVADTIGEAVAIALGMLV